MMFRMPGDCRRPVLLLLWLYFTAEEHTTYAHNKTEETREMERLFCEPGYYCPEGSSTPVPCPRGTFGPNAGAVSIDSCLSCPNNHYCPRPGLHAGLPCGASARQPLPGQLTCVCLGEGQSFQASDGHCTCALGYQLTGKGDMCWHRVYDICKDGRARTQHGICLDRKQWAQHCTQQVCPSLEDYQGFDGSLGLCLCREPPERALCGRWCRSGSRQALHLVCAGRDLELVYSTSESESQVSISGSVLLDRVFKRLDSQGALLCDGRHNISIPVYTVQTSDQGFLGLLNAIPVEIQKIFSEKSPGHHSSTGAMTWGGSSNSSSVGVLNPTTCLHLGDTLLFTVTRKHYPQYDIENLYNTNSDFDWGPLRRLAEDLSLARTPPTLFSMVFTQPGVYAFKLTGNQYKHMYVRVMPASAQCYEAGPFFNTDPHHLTRMGIAKRQHLLLRPDWSVTGGLLLGAVVILSLCTTLLMLFRDYGWPEKVSHTARYRTLQLQYPMDDYSSKGSRVTTLKKYHRNLQASRTDASGQPDEFWDYEHQVDLEAFNTNTFYSILMKHSLSVTARLGQLREEVEQEVVRRKSLAQQLRHLLDSQLGVLRTELRAQQAVHKAFGSCLRESLRLVGQAADHPHHVLQRLKSLTSEMTEQVSKECQRQGAWAALGEGTGAKLLCPDTGSVLSKEDIFAPDGSVRSCVAVHTDSITGLILPKPHTHMLLASGHSMPVPPEFFFHPQTGRLLPIVGNVGYDPASSTLVFTTDSCTGDLKKWDLPLLPFVPYPLFRHSSQPVTTKLRGLRPGQRLLLGGPMCDPETGLLVPILAVTIHPQTGLVYPLGGVHVCPITRLHQPIQVGSPMLDPRTGSVVLTVGVCLDSKTGAVLPVGGLLLGESFIEPMSGKLVRVGGGSIRAGKLVPHSGGFQALLASQTLGARIRLLELLQGLKEDLGSGEMGLQGRIQAAAKDLEQAWGTGLHSQLQLLSRLETMLDWAGAIAKDGGVQGEIHLPGSDLSLPALPGMEYLDPQGSGLMVPVLGAQIDPVSGLTVPLAGTMEDPDGKGLVAIRFGSLTVDPVTGVLAAVVGARLDVSRQTVVPVTASYCLALGEHPDSVPAEALQKEWCLRNRFWKQEKQKEEELLGDLDAALEHCLHMATQDHFDEAHWADAERQLREAASVLQETGQSEAQRRASQLPELTLLLPAHILHILTQGDESEWELRCFWHSELGAGLDRVNVCVEKLQHNHERWTTQRERPMASIHVTDLKMRLKESWEQLNCRQTELEGALIDLQCVRELCQFCADIAQSVLSGSSWYKEYGVARLTFPSYSLKMMSLTQRKALPLLEQLIQLLEENKHPSLSLSTYRQRISGMSTQSLREPVKTLLQDQDVKGLGVPQPSPSLSQTAHKKIDIQQSHERQSLKDPVLSSHVCVPTLSVEEWDKLLELSPVFQMLKGVEQKLRLRAQDAGLLRRDLNCKGSSFIDYLDAQWECEGDLVPLDPDNLNSREFLVYQHGLYLLKTLHTLKLTPAMALKIAASLPSNNYKYNAFRNSFYYKEAEQTVYVRRQRLQSVGGFSLLLLHCSSHITIGEMSFDYTPSFQRVFFKVLQACLSELFEIRLVSSSLLKQTATTKHYLPLECHPTQSDPTSLLQMLQRPSRGTLSQEGRECLLEDHSAASVLLYVEKLLKEKSLDLQNMEDQCKDQMENSNLAQ
ncbi:hypothetical protein UPYG_G00197840 [Umbra pygmaea]|uniref:Uncharacterized protein n=1 Tax=Umbra pygmaea TaxID=75934 RepID=A0ABD0X1Q8_UMBPY